MQKRVRTFIAFVAIWVASSYAAWDGSVKIPKIVKDGGSDYYEITSPAELIGFLDSVLVNKGGDESLRAYLKNDIVFGADTSKLCEKRWVRNVEQSMFTGDFDGRGHSIYGLNAENSLFKVVGMSAGTVHDLNVANSSFGSDSAFYAAAIAENLNASIRNVNVIATDVHATSYAGGIAANVVSSYAGEGYNAFILNSNVIGGSVGGGLYVGGIAAFSTGQILGCSNSARIYFTPFEIKNRDTLTVYIGGLAGYVDVRSGAAIENGVNRGNVEIESPNSGSFVGGVAGCVLGSVHNLHNYGNILSKVKFTKYTARDNWKIFSNVGGIAGRLSISQVTSGESRDLLNDGKVDAYLDNAMIKGDLSVGGVVGTLSVSVANALNRGSVEAHGYGLEMETCAGGVFGSAYTNAFRNGLTKIKNRGDVYAAGTYRTYVGGVVGWMETLWNEGLTLSFNYGSVTGAVAEPSDRSETMNVGGIAGYSNDVVIKDVYNRGEVVARYKLRHGVSYVGGIVGMEYSCYYNFIQNSYSAAPELVGDTVGGIIGHLSYSSIPDNVYFDKTIANALSIGYATGVDLTLSDRTCAACRKTTTEMQSDEMVTLLNTEGGKVADRKEWTRRGGYPVLSFDSVYKNDSVFFDMQQYALPTSKMVNDTLVYTISTANELTTFLEIGRSFSREKFKVQLANDIVMGEDSLHLAMRKISIDTSSYCMNMDFDGQGHTIYGLNMTRAMFFCLDSTSVVENVTIANSRFANDFEMPSAAVAIKNGGCVRNVSVRNSLVKGGSVVGGLVAYNWGKTYGVVLDSKNENTTVLSTENAGGIAGVSSGVLQNLSNSGRVYGSRSGGIAGYVVKMGSPAFVGNCTNTGMVLASGEFAFTLDYIYSAGGIVGYGSNATVDDVLNTGLVEVSSVTQNVAAGGILGRMDSTKLTGDGNWGRVHALSGNNAYAGGLVGHARGMVYRSNGERIPMTPVLEDFNYGPVSVGEAAKNAYAGGLVGWGSGLSFTNVYNRGGVRNAAVKSMTGGIIAFMDTSSIGTAYSYVVDLAGDKVGNVAYETRGKNSYDGIVYGSNWNMYPDRGIYKENSALRDTLVLAMSFDEMKYESISKTVKSFAFDSWVDKGCLPVLKHDTTSACAESVVKDSFGDSNEPYIVGYKETVVYADSSSRPVEIGVKPMTKMNLMQIEVSARNIVVAGLSENHAVAVFDMQGRLVKSARVHGAEVRLTVPHAGRYLVRSGSLAKIVSVR